MKNILALLAIALVGTAVTAQAQTTYAGNTNTGFGGPIGTGSLVLTDDGTNLSGTLTRGSGDFNDSLTIYLNTTGSGASSLPASGEIGNPDYGRRSVVNEFGSGIDAFPGLFTADYALVLAPTQNADVIFSIPSSGADANTITFVTGISATNLGSNNAATYSFSFALADIGVTGGLGNSFNFIATYGNPTAGGGGDATFRSNESFAPVFVGQATNPGFDNVSFASFNTYTTSVTPIPEPSTALGALLLIGGVVCGKRRKRA